MNSSYIYTKRLMHLDVKVLFTLLLVFLLSTCLLGYSIIEKNKTIPCKPLDILIFGQRNSKDKTYYIGDQLIFRVPGNIGDKVTWDFGDKSPKVEGAGTRHIFTEEKKFSVTVLINGKCPSNITVNIKKKENTIIDTFGNVVQPILGSPEATVGDAVIFTTSIQANSYRWSINKSGYPILNSKEATYTFKTSGIYTLRLMVDDDRQRQYEFIINIKPLRKLIDDDGGSTFQPPPKDSSNGNKPPVEQDTEKVKPPPPPLLRKVDQNLRIKFRRVT